MEDKALLAALLAAETEEAALEVLDKRGLFNDEKRWKVLGGMLNNQSIVHNQQTTAAAAMVEKVTNAIDAILMRKVRAAGIDPRGPQAPQSMPAAIEKFYGDLNDDNVDVRKLAEESMVMYATGSNALPSIALYDAGEGQLAEDFPKTFCSLIFGSAEGAYKGAVEFTQGRFNMGGTGVLPFCGENRKMQLIVSRVPDDMNPKPHDWAFTVFCFFPHKSSPSWKYLVGTDGNVMTAGSEPMGLVPKLLAKSGEVCAPRERKVTSGTLIKMYNFKSPKSNICGELYRKLEDYLLKPVLPLRLIECREHYKANVMQITIWNRLAKWSKKKLEEGFEDGASIQIKLVSGETIPAEVRVFKMEKDDSEQDAPQTGLRALINGQSHAKRDTQFFKTNAVNLEHIAGSMLVTLDCTGLNQTSRNAIFMANRETFRDDDLLKDLFKKLQKELRNHEGLQALNKKRYEEKVANATSDELGISALEELLQTDPSLAELFSSMMPGKIAAATKKLNPGDKVTGDPKPEFVGKEYPTFFRRSDGMTVVKIDLPKDDDARTSFNTDVVNNYFSRPKHAGKVKFVGQLEPTFHLFNGRLTFTFHAPKKAVVGTAMMTQIEISDDAGHGPFKLVVTATIVSPREKAEPKPPKPPQTAQESPSRPNVIEVNRGPDALPLTIEKEPNSTRLQLAVNKDSKLLEQAKLLKKPEEVPAVEFVFKYGLALIAMGLLENVKQTPEWKTNEQQCRKNIEEHCAGIARVIVPLCLTLPQKLPKAA